MTERQSNDGDKLRRVGAMWKPRAGAKSLGTGSITINGLRQRFVILPNSRKTKDTDPDFVLMSSAEPETDTYTQRTSSHPAGRAHDASGPGPLDPPF